MKNNHISLVSGLIWLGTCSEDWLERAVRSSNWMYSSLLWLSLPFLVAIYGGAWATYYFGDWWYVRVGLHLGCSLALPLVSVAIFIALSLFISFLFSMGLGMLLGYEILLRKREYMEKGNPTASLIFYPLVFCRTLFMTLALFVCHVDDAFAAQQE